MGYGCRVKRSMLDHMLAYVAVHSWDAASFAPYLPKKKKKKTSVYQYEVEVPRRKRRRYRYTNVAAGQPPKNPKVKNNRKDAK